MTRKGVMMDRYAMRCAAVVVLMVTPVVAAGGVVAEWDFSKGTQGWSGNGQVQPVVSTAEGLVVRSTGEDPWIEGPAIDFPSPDGMAGDDPHEVHGRS